MALLVRTLLLVLLALPRRQAHAFTAPPSGWTRRQAPAQAPAAPTAPSEGSLPKNVGAAVLAAAAAAKADDDDDAPAAANLPFFASLSAEPAVFPETKSSPDGVGGVGTTTVTTRLPLGTLFDSRDYVFTAATNVRGYEWTLKETDELFDDLADVAVGDLSPNRHRGDYELSQIVLVPMDWDRATFGLGARYDVHDGQQRLVTLCLLFAALRESFRAASEEEDDDVVDEQHSMDDIVEELTSMLNPPKVRKAPVLRIELRKRDNDMLRRILSPDLVTVDEEQDGEGEERVQIDIPPPDERSDLSSTNRRILTNYERLVERVADLNVTERFELLDYLVEHVYMLVCVPETASIARNIVMGQGKGMNTEPIDDFKGLVCFRYTLEEDDMYRTFDRWDALASMPPDVESGCVGRDTVASACLLRAAAALRHKIRKNDEVSALEAWLRHDLIRNGCEGKDFYGRAVEPASLALRRFRDGAFDSFTFASGEGGKEEEEELRRSIETRLGFLWGMTSSVASTKEVEIVILELLLRAGEGGEGYEPLTVQELDEYLRGVEIAAGWMAVARPPPLRRHQRCFAMLDAIDAGSRGDAWLDAVATREEKSALRDDIASLDFGSTPMGKKIAIPLLERLNAHLLVQQDGGMGEGAELSRGVSAQYQVEHILPTNPYRKYWKDQWSDEEDRNYWLHRLGNLALVSRKVTAKEGNSAFDDKKKRYEKEVWPLTRQLSELDDWSKDAMIEQHGKTIGLIGKIWDL